MKALKRTVVFDSYWRFAAERLNMFERRLAEPIGPWTDDPILKTYRFTNSYRVLDRVSQYLVREVQFGEGRSRDGEEMFFRTLLFKIFNRIDTWETLEARLGLISWRATCLDRLLDVLDSMFRNGRIYSAAYIMPAPPMGHARKHANHLTLLSSMMSDGLPNKVQRARSLQEVYQLLLGYPGLGRFLAFQFAIDLNYSGLSHFSEEEFVVAGPGALDGLAKCFANASGQSSEAIIHWVVETQDKEFSRLGLDFRGLYGRPLQPIDCQNLFCEISKYARVAHPTHAGVLGRTRIKQNFVQKFEPLPIPKFPPHWKMNRVAGKRLRG